MDTHMLNLDAKNKDTVVAALAFSYQIARRLGPIGTSGHWALRTRDLLMLLAGQKQAEVALRVADNLVEAVTLKMGQKAVIRKLFGDSGLEQVESFLATREGVTAVKGDGGFIAASSEYVSTGEEVAKLLAELLTLASTLSEEHES
jgi:hypothetical protein